MYRFVKSDYSAVFLTQFFRRQPTIFHEKLWGNTKWSENNGL